MIRRRGEGRRRFRNQRVDGVVLDEHLRDVNVLRRRDLAVIGSQHLLDSLRCDVERNRFTVFVRHRRRHARDDGRAHTRAGSSLVLHAVLADETQELIARPVARLERDVIGHAHQRLVTLDLVHHDVTARVLFHHKVQIFDARNAPRLLRELLRVANHRSLESIEFARRETV